MDIHDVIAERFPTYDAITPDNSEICVFDLHVALTQAGLVTDQIYELAVHPVKSAVDGEAVAATARALLAHLGQMGCYVDALMKFTVSLRGAQIVPKGTGRAARDAGVAKAA